VQLRRVLGSGNLLPSGVQVRFPQYESAQDLVFNKVMVPYTGSKSNLLWLHWGIWGSELVPNYSGAAGHRGGSDGFDMARIRLNVDTVRDVDTGRTSTEEKAEDMAMCRKPVMIVGTDTSFCRSRGESVYGESAFPRVSLTLFDSISDLLDRSERSWQDEPEVGKTELLLCPSTTDELRALREVFQNAFAKFHKSSGSSVPFWRDRATLQFLANHFDGVGSQPNPAVAWLRREIAKSFEREEMAELFDRVDRVYIRPSFSDERDTKERTKLQRDMLGIMNSMRYDRYAAKTTFVFSPEAARSFGNGGLVHGQRVASANLLGKASA
jgi:hypothetical protein